MFGANPTAAPESCVFQAFYGSVKSNTGSTVSVYPFQVPSGASMIEMFLLGGGGYGGGGFSGSATNRGGGGGAGSGAITRLLIPAKLLPPVLYVAPGFGGKRAISASASQSIVSVAPGAGGTFSTKDIVVYASSGANGGTGTGTAVGAGGSGGVITAASGANFMNLGIWTSVAGQAGGAGGAVAGGAGTDVTWASSTIIPVTGGAGGGGAGSASGDFAGGGIIGTTNATEAPLMPSVAGGASAAGRGTDGLCRGYGSGLFLSCGGTGGGTAAAAGTGGAGGHGAYGSGGGGGGAGVTGGDGGNGGPGLVFIWAW